MIEDRGERDDRRDRKGELLEVAIRCFARRGYHATTLDQIAAEAGVSKGAVYWHYKDKAELFASVMREWVTRLTASVGQSVSRTEHGQERLRVFLIASLDFYRRNPDFAVLFGRLRNAPELEVGPGVVSRLQNAYECVREQLSGIIAAEMRSPYPVSPAALASILIALVDGLVLQWVLDPAAVDLEKLAAVAADTALRGMEWAWSASPESA